MCFTRKIGAGPYKAGCAGAPPPLHVVPDSPGKSWYPAERVTYARNGPGPEMVFFPIVAPVGEDPTDPSTHMNPHMSCSGMMARFNIGPRMERGTVQP